VEAVKVPFVVMKFPVTVQVPPPEVMAGVPLPPLVKDRLPVIFMVTVAVVANKVGVRASVAPVITLKFPATLYVPAAGVQALLVALRLV
jgi:hypothetical protein